VIQLRREIARCSVLAHQTDHAGRAGPLCPPPERTARPARRSLGEGGRSVPTSQAIVRSSLNRLQHEASSFASAIRAGRAAARDMWRRSRDSHVRGPNQLMLDRDTKRLREWAQWLQRAARNPEMILDSAGEPESTRSFCWPAEQLRGTEGSTAESRMIWQTTPVCGAWQLLFTVHNFAPALQKVVVEQQEPDGTWETIHSLHTIEFRAFAARPRIKIRREFSVPLPVAAGNCRSLLAHSTGSFCWPAERDCRGAGDRSSEIACEQAPTTYRPLAVTPRRPPGPETFSGRIRLAIRGVGQVAISHVEITNGVDRCSPKGWPAEQERRLGRPAPKRGFPDARFR